MYLQYERTSRTGYHHDIYLEQLLFLCISHPASHHFVLYYFCLQTCPNTSRRNNFYLCTLLCLFPHHTSPIQHCFMLLVQFFHCLGYLKFSISAFLPKLVSLSLLNTCNNGIILQWEKFSLNTRKYFAVVNIVLHVKCKSCCHLWECNYGVVICFLL